jgi:hypothetical protein
MIYAWSFSDLGFGVTTLLPWRSIAMTLLSSLNPFQILHPLGLKFPCARLSIFLGIESQLFVGYHFLWKIFLEFAVPWILEKQKRDFV